MSEYWSDYWKVENPMVIDPAPKKRRWYEEDEEEDEPVPVYKFRKKIDVSRLTEEEGELLLGVFEDIRDAYEYRELWEDDTFQGWLHVKEEGGVMYVKGRVTNEDETLISDTLFEMRDKIEVSEWK